MSSSSSSSHFLLYVLTALRDSKLWSMAFPFRASPISCSIMAVHSLFVVFESDPAGTAHGRDCNMALSHGEKWDPSAQDCRVSLVPHLMDALRRVRINR